jgi:DNA-binding XRE family transcriptional regulator
MTQQANDSGATVARMTVRPSDVLRMGRLGMGWSEAALARTVAVSEETIREWEAGIRPVPPKIVAWVGMYVRRADTASDADPEQDAPAAA